MKKYRFLFGQQHIWSEDGKKDTLPFCNLFSITFFSDTNKDKFETLVSQSSSDIILSYQYPSSQNFIDNFQRILDANEITYKKFQVKELSSKPIEFKEMIERFDWRCDQSFLRSYLDQSRTDQVDYLYMLFSSKHDFYPDDSGIKNCVSLFRFTNNKKEYFWENDCLYIRKDIWLDEDMEDGQEMGFIKREHYDWFNPYSYPDTSFETPILFKENQPTKYGYCFLTDVFKELVKNIPIEKEE